MQLKMDLEDKLIIDNQILIMGALASLIVKIEEGSKTPDDIPNSMAMVKAIYDQMKISKDYEYS